MVLGARRSPATAVRANLQDFPFEEHYGVSRLSDRLTTPPNYFWQIKNAYVNKMNWIEQRNGYAAFSVTAIGASTKVRKLFEFENKTGGKTVIARGGTVWNRYDDSGNLTALDTGRGSDAYGQACQFNNELIMCDGGAPRKSTAAWSVSNVGASAPSNSSACWTHNHRCVLNNDANYMETYISKVDTLDFDTAGNDAIILNISKIIPEGDRILGYSSFGNTFLVIWLERNIVIYDVPTTYANIQLEQVIRGVGCISYDGIIYTPDGDIWFPSQSGYKSLKTSLATNNTIDIQDITTLLGPHYRNSLSTVSARQDINGVFYTKLNHGYFTLPFSSNPEIWIISKDLETATKGKGNIAGHFEGITSHSFLQRKNGDLLFGSNNGHIYKMDNGANDNGSAVTFQVQKTGLYLGNPKIFKSPREFNALLEATATLTATLEISFDIQASTTSTITESITVTTQVSLWDTAVWDVALWDAAGKVDFTSRNLKGRGKLINITLSHSTLNAQLRFPYFILSVFSQGDK